MALRLDEPGIRANVIGLGTNTGLAIAKLVVGFLAASEALTADGFNSAGDIVATAVGFAGYAYARRPPDDDHHYGHGNAESVAGLMIGGILLATGAFIAISGVLALVDGKIDTPGEGAIWVAGITAIIKEWLYRYTVRVGKQLNSPSLLASACDHRADVLIAITVLAAVLAARLGVPALDPIAAVVIGLYIVWFSIAPIRSNVGILMDEAPSGVREEVERIAVADAAVERVDQTRVHPLGSYYVVDLEISVDGALSLHQAHDIAHRVGDSVQAQVPNVTDVKVHVNPF